MRYFLFSTIFHLLLVLGGFSLLKEEISFSSVGNSKVTFSEFNGSSAQTIKVNPSKKSEGDKRKKIDKKKKKLEKKKAPIKKEIKIVEKKPKVKEVKKKKEIPDNNNQREKIFKETVIAEDKSNGKLESKETSENRTSEKVSKNEDSNAQSEEMAGFVQLKDGSLVAKNQGVKGLKYGFLNNPEPNYPQIAKKLGIKDIIKIRARILIGYDGRVEEVKYYDNNDKYGFREEVKKALDHWKTTPIESNGVKVKLYFHKEFRFELEN